MKNKQFVSYLDQPQEVKPAKEAVAETAPLSPEELRWSDPNRVIERKLDGGDEVVAKLGAIPLSIIARTPEQHAREAIEQAAFDEFAHREENSH